MCRYSYVLLQVVYGKHTTELSCTIVGGIVEMNVNVADNQQIGVRSDPLQDVG